MVLQGVGNSSECDGVIGNLAYNESSNGLGEIDFSKIINKLCIASGTAAG